MNVPGYEIGEELGRGGMGVVFAARRRTTGEPVALKVLLEDHVDAPQTARRMQTAWLVGQGLCHPNLLRVIDFGLDGTGRTWLASERLEGPSLLRALAAEGRLDSARTAAVGMQAAEALAVLHRRGAVHRDVKPDNFVLVDDDRRNLRIKLIDFGTVSLSRDDPARAHATTQGGLVLGTPDYMPPEQCNGRTLDGRTDIYALGVTLYQLVCGHVPFADRGKAPLARIVANLREEPPRVDAQGVPVDPALATLIHACLAKAADDRPQSAEAVHDALYAIALELRARTVTTTLTMRPSAPPTPPPSAIDSDGYRVAVLEWLAARGSDAPSAVSLAAEAVARSAELVVAATQDARARREQADQYAARLIPNQRELEDQRHDLAAKLDELRNEYVGRSVAIMRSAERLERLDRQHAGIVASLEEGADDGALSADEIARRLAEVERLAAEHDAVRDQRRAARREAEGVRAALYRLKTTLADLDERLATVSRMRESEGDLLELAATEAEDERVAAEAKAKHSSTRLYLLALGASVDA